MDSGIFVTLFDKETLKLYLARGIYSFLMPPVSENEIPYRTHYAALADYSCVRGGTHVFFFLKREIIYGGMAKGSKNVGAFYLNGQLSPLGRNAKSELAWDESIRKNYRSTSKPGIFDVEDNEKIWKTKCQPYLILFETDDLTGRMISSDELYMELGKFPYPLPSNSIQNMSFCTLTPGETRIALMLLKNAEKVYQTESSELIELANPPQPFRAEFGIKNIKQSFERSEIKWEALLEAEILANPNLLPSEITPACDYTLCRQVPVSPFKPFQMDRADICFYLSDDSIGEGTIPNIILELKKGTGNNKDVNQVVRYFEWLNRVVPNDILRIKAYLLAPKFTNNAIVNRFRNQIKLVKLT